MATLNAAPAARHPNRTWSSVLDFLASVTRASQILRASNGTGQVDSRLFAAAGSPSEEGNGADGGYAVPPDFRQAVADAVFGEQSLLGYVGDGILRTTSNSIAIPVNVVPDYASSDPQVSSQPEGGGQLPPSKLALSMRDVRLSKLSALVPATSELVEDVPSLSAFLNQLLAGIFAFKVNDYFINGDGVNKPLGILNSPALVIQAKESGQSSGTILYANLSKMFSRLLPGLRQNACWLMHSSAEEAIRELVAPVGSLSGMRYPPSSVPMLFGRPVIISEACQVIGTPGDVLLVAPQGLCVAMKPVSIKQDVSMDVWFDQDAVAFRFTMRIGMSPWLNGPVAQLRGGSTVSSIVALATR